MAWALDMHGMCAGSSWRVAAGRCRVEMGGRSTAASTRPVHAHPTPPRSGSTGKWSRPRACTSATSAPTCGNRFTPPQPSVHAECRGSANCREPCRVRGSECGEMPNVRCAVRALHHAHRPMHHHVFPPHITHYSSPSTMVSLNPMQTKATTQNSTGNPLNCLFGSSPGCQWASRRPISPPAEARPGTVRSRQSPPQN